MKRLRPALDIKKPFVSDNPKILMDDNLLPTKSAGPTRMAVTSGFLLDVQNYEILRSIFR